jgi:hypothetical protein
MKPLNDFILQNAEPLNVKAGGKLHVVISVL